MRAGILPYERITPIDCLTRNCIGGNSGNLLFQNSMTKALSTKGTEIIPNRYQVDLNDADWINQECSAFVLPMADAFRPSFVKELRELTELVKRLTIPCIVTGVGLSASYEPDFSRPFSFDQDVKNFVNAVLEKSTMLGLRGEFTAEYLTKLGYKPEQDFTVIGCPSFYTNGAHMKLRELNLNQDTKVSLNTILYPQANLENFIARTSDSYKNHYFVGQEKMELRLLYSGCDFRASSLYPCNTVDSDYYQQQRARFFINVPTWLDFMKTMDISVGPRMHGNVASLIADTPTILFAIDSRTRELMQYHKVPGMAAKDITENMTLEELVEKVDFRAIEVQHQQNFNHFVDFLDKNGLENIYSTPQDKDYYQEKMNSIELYPEIKPILQHTNETFENGVRVSYDWLLEHYYTFSANYYLYSKWMDAKIKGKSTLDYLKEKGYQKIAIYGIHDIAHKLYEEIKDDPSVEIAYIIDPKDGQVFHDLSVKSLESCDTSHVDAIIVTNVSAFKEIKDKFKEKDKVISIREMIDVISNAKL